jgi:hypothetical protein
VFGGKFRAGLQKLKTDGKLEFHGKVQALEEPKVFGKLLHKLKTQKFVVYAKRPFAGPEAVLKYLSRYTHRVAIGNRRLLALDERSVTFSYKDYADESRRKTMTLSIEEFTRRFCLHLLPERFVKIRHYGLLGNRDRQERITRARESLGAKEAETVETGPTLNAQPSPLNSDQRLRCPHCGALALVCVGEVPRSLRWIKPILICDSS